MKHKDKTTNFIIPLVIYPFDIMISIGETDNQLKKALTKAGADWDDILTMPTTGLGRTAMLSSNQTVLRLKGRPTTPVQHGTLAHEIFHAVSFIMDRIGMKLIICQSDEAYAYLIGYITKEIYRRI